MFDMVWVEYSWFLPQKRTEVGKKDPVTVLHDTPFC